MVCTCDYECSYNIISSYGIPMGCLGRPTTTCPVLFVCPVLRCPPSCYRIPIGLRWDSYGRPRQTNNKGCPLLLVCPVSRWHCCPVLVIAIYRIPIGLLWDSYGFHGGDDGDHHHHHVSSVAAIA